MFHTFWSTVWRKRPWFEHMQMVQEVEFILAWSSSELWTVIKYSRSKIKNLKPTAVDVLFKAYPMVPISSRSNLAGWYLLTDWKPWALKPFYKTESIFCFVQMSYRCITVSTQALCFLSHWSRHLKTGELWFLYFYSRLKWENSVIFARKLTVMGATDYFYFYFHVAWWDSYNISWLSKKAPSLSYCHIR